MIYQQLISAANESPDAACLIEDDQTWTNQHLVARVDKLAQRLGACRGRTIGITTTSAANLLIALGAVDAAGSVPVLLPTTTGPIRSDEQAEALNLATTLCDACVENDRPIEIATSSEDGSSSNTNSVVLFTSGTSGPPRPVAHDWPSLTAAVKIGEDYQSRLWILAYQPHTFAGLQVLLQSMLSGGTLLVATRNPSADASQLDSNQVEFASATPTYWRSILNCVPIETLRRWSLHQITLGGEVADQLLLDRLRDTFPLARITHIYATTELGVCFSVHDGKAGFPIRWLKHSPAACRIRIVDNEMQIKTAHSTHWMPTGDLVATTDDRVLFAGRRSDTINIGGQKVMPLAIESVIRPVPHVLEVRVFGVASSLTGQLVAAEVQLADGVDEASVREGILTACREKLPKHMIPATLSFSTQPLAAADKLSRIA